MHPNRPGSNYSDGDSGHSAGVRNSHEPFSLAKGFPSVGALTIALDSSIIPLAFKNGYQCQRLLGIADKLKSRDCLLT